MPAVEVKNFESPDETRPFEGKGQANVVILAGKPVGRGARSSPAGSGRSTSSRSPGRTRARCPISATASRDG